MGKGTVSKKQRANGLTWIYRFQTTRALDGKTVENGADLGIPGYTKVTVAKGPGKGIIVRGQGWVNVDKSNYKQYPF